MLFFVSICVKISYPDDYKPQNVFNKSHVEIFIGREKGLPLGVAAHFPPGLCLDTLHLFSTSSALKNI